jgi:hypothetical protein
MGLSRRKASENAVLAEVTPEQFEAAAACPQSSSVT